MIIELKPSATNIDVMVDDNFIGRVPAELGLPLDGSTVIKKAHRIEKEVTLIVGIMGDPESQHEVYLTIPNILQPSKSLGAEKGMGLENKTTNAKIDRLINNRKNGMVANRKMSIVEQRRMSGPDKIKLLIAKRRKSGI